MLSQGHESVESQPWIETASIADLAGFTDAIVTIGSPPAYTSFD